MFFGAFFLLPLARLFLVGGSGRDGFATYATIITDRNHFASLLATLALAAATTVVTLIVSGLAGVFLQRNKFPGNTALVAMLTLPLAFPGVVIGFMVIMLAGRQGLIGSITQALIGERIVFAYSMAGLFMGYVYFSIPRTILTVMATAEKLDPRLEEAARSLGASPWQVIRDVIIPGLKPALHLGRRDLLRHRHGRLRHRLHARNAHQRAADGDLHGVHAAGEHRGRRRAFVRARRRDLDRARSSPAPPPAAPSRRRDEGAARAPRAARSSLPSSPSRCWCARS